MLVETTSNMKTAISIKLLTPLRMLLLLILFVSKPILGITSSLQGDGVRCLDRERLALLEFKDRLRYVEGLDTWGSEEHKKDCCKWQGVRCDNLSNHVVRLNLRYIKLIQGNISEALGNLVSLSYLDLSGQWFEGRIPDTLGNLAFLSHLDLSNNSLEGAIPDSLGNLIHLSHLDLSGNLLEAGIPHTFGNLTSLSHLDMSRNDDDSHEGWIIPEALGNLESLSLLNLSFTKLKGRIPNSLGNLTSLLELDLSYNKLEDGIPDSFGNLTSLRHLDLSGNILEGGIPFTLGNITRLSHLDLSTNKFEGSIPDALWNLSSLSHLDISNNKISGTSLGSFRKISLISYLDMSYNHIFGLVPDFSSNFPALLTLDLSVNEFNGSVPIFPPHLEILNLRKNKISGKLNGICRDGINRLALLDVSENLLSGELPSCLQNFESLMYLNLAENNFSGEIQDSISWPSTLYSLHLWSNSFRGEIPKSLRGCSGLRYLVLGENYFTGEIPAWIGESLSNLSFLSLPSNYFNGSFPSTLCHLQKLQVLDISSNNISGTIPSCFNNLTSMYSKPLRPLEIKYQANMLKGISSGVLNPVRPCNYATPKKPQSDERECLVCSYAYNCGPRLKKTKYAPPSRSRTPTIPNKYDRFKVVWKGNEAEENHETLYILKLIDLSENKLIGEIPYEVAGLDGLIALNLSGNHLVGSIPPKICEVEPLNFLDLSRNNLTGRIPDALSQLNQLGVLNLSYNNLSGRIPWSNHLTTFNSYSFLGNPELCGLPLSHPCPGDDEKHGMPNFTDNVDGMDGDKLITKGFYVSMTFGVVVGFWCVIGTLLLNRTCRFAYFRMPVTVKDWLYVKIVICWRRWT